MIIHDSTEDGSRNVCEGSTAKSLNQQSIYELIIFRYLLFPLFTGKNKQFDQQSGTLICIGLYFICVSDDKILVKLTMCHVNST